jgi:predicted glycoside hydrolase/deacetylase ChbG (UPF0249 family)
VRVDLHGDDMGITAGASRSLLEAWAAGWLDGFSVLANGEGVGLVTDELARHPDRPARVAVHFNLTEGPPSATPDRVKALVDAQGALTHSFGSLLARRWLGSRSAWRALLDEIELECREQIRAVRAICGDRAIQSIDGHNHVHMIPGVFSAVVRAARAERVPEIRISREPFYIAGRLDLLHPFWWINLLKHSILRTLSRGAAPVAAAAGLDSPDYLIGVLYTGHMTGQRAKAGIQAAQVRPGTGRIQVAFHLGVTDPAEAGKRWTRGERRFHLSPWRSIEFDELRQLRHELAAKAPPA